eukprot:4567252-Pyramimonas_sp.AAC.1
MAAQDGPKTPSEAFQIVTRSSRETAVGGRVARGSPQRPSEHAQEASRRKHGGRITNNIVIAAMPEKE